MHPLQNQTERPLLSNLSSYLIQSKMRNIFLVECIVNKTERDILFSNVERLFKNFSCLDIEEKNYFPLEQQRPAGTYQGW